ncbi:MAG TPA: CaiB/BaiF CoA-transferase family protein [Thermodesulfobacteriota bacterium]
MTLPLSGIRVLDLTRVLAGPYCTMILGDLGADVVKVEPAATGDETRSWGPPFQGGESTYFLAINRNKRSLALDLKQAAALEAARRLAARADVVVENFRPGVAERLGLGARALTAAHPGLVYCSISAFGQTGPGRDRPGYDLVVQAASGVMSVTGEADGPPVKVGIAIADVLTGMNAAIAIVAALHARAARGGRGGVVDAALYDSLIAFLSTLVTGFAATGRPPTRWGSAHPQIAPYQGFRAADGDLVVCVTNDKFWRSLCDLLERPDLKDDPRFATNPDRVAHREALLPLLEAAFATKPVAEWMGRLEAAGIPAAPIRTLDAALADPVVEARGMLAAVEHATAGTVRMPGVPWQGDAAPTAIRRPPPRLGEHTDEILAEIGYDAADIARMRASGAVR